MVPLTLEVLQGEYTVYRLPPQTPLPPVTIQSSFFSVTRTEEELSVVCDSSLLLDAETSESGWSCIKVLGPLDFALTGILARLSTILAEAEISIFAVSTYDTDYLLVKTEKLTAAIAALSDSGYLFGGYRAAH